MIGKWKNRGFSVTSEVEGKNKEDANAILVDPLFLQAKKGDWKSAKALWTREWNRNVEQNDALLKAALENGKTPVFISVPGTTRRNQIPCAAAACLVQKIGSRAYFLNGDKHFIPLHTSMMKSIAKGERVFHPRVFEEKEGVFERVRKCFPNAQFFVVEDMLTTGNSAHSFQRFLENNGLPVSGVIALKGEYDAIVHPNLVKKIGKFFQQNGINVDAESFCREVTGKEAQTIAFQTTAIYQHADDEHKEKLKKLFEAVADVKINRNVSRILLVDELAWDIKRYLEQKKEKECPHDKEQNESKSNQNQGAQGPVSALLHTLTKNSKRGAGQVISGRAAEHGIDVARTGVRDNQSHRQSTGNSAGRQQPGTLKFKKGNEY